MNKPYDLLKTLTKTPLLILCIAIITGVFSTAVSAPVFTASLDATGNGIFLNHGFVCNEASDASISNVVVWLQQRNFKFQFLNISKVDSDGTMDDENYSQLAHWIQVSRATDPSQKIVAYISGTADQVSCGPTCWKNIADLCQIFFTNYGVDGVNLDFEPYKTDVADYIGLFKTIRSEVGPKAFLSLDYTATASATWSPADFKAASKYINWIMPMLYDNSSTNVSEYDAFIAQALTWQYKNLTPGSQLYPIIPSYSASTYHDPNVENIHTALGEIRKLTDSNQIKVPGIGVWWYYEWDTNAETGWHGGLNPGSSPVR